MNSVSTHIMSPNIDISIILPAYNEGHRLAKSILLIQEAVLPLTSYYEIIIVNDGSSDNTHIEADRLANTNISVISYDKNRGKGYAVKVGMVRAKGKFHLFMDVDLATDLKAMAEFYRSMQENPVDILIGDRKTDTNVQHVKQPYLRRMLGRVFTWLSQMVLHCHFRDFTCGFKMFTSGASQRIFACQRIDRWSFDSEILFLAEKYHLKVREIPVIWRHQGNSKVNLWKDILSSFQGLIAIRINDFKGIYN